MILISQLGEASSLADGPGFTNLHAELLFDFWEHGIMKILSVLVMGE